MLPLLVLLALSPVPASVADPTALFTAPQASGARISSSGDDLSASLPSALPQPPRDVRVKRTSEGHVITWRRPAGRTDTPLSGYVVLVGEQVLTVPAGRHRLVVPHAPQRVVVAATNGVGSSLASSPAHGLVPVDLAGAPPVAPANR